MRKAVLISGGVLALVMIWHLIQINRLGNDLEVGGHGDVDVSVNPITNVVKITFLDLDEDDWGVQLAIGIMGMAMPGIIERELNTRAREVFDVYAMVIPYRARLLTEAGAPLAALGEDDDETPEDLAIEPAATPAPDPEPDEPDQGLIDRERRAAYIDEHLRLTNTRVGAGTSAFGRERPGVFGTIVNDGDEMIARVEVRVYFLGEDDRRIGEKDYSPVWSSNRFDPTTPLRPGYQHDFGYAVDGEAPSAWAGEAEFEIVDIEFASD